MTMHLNSRRVRRPLQKFRKAIALALACAISSPAHAGIVSIWTNAAGGGFSFAGNWSNGIPVAGDVAIFRQNALNTYSVTFGSVISNDVLRVGLNDVTFNAAGQGHPSYSITNTTTTENNRGIIIGEINSETASLTPNLTLTGVAMTLGDGAGSQGTLNVSFHTTNITGNSQSDAELIVGNYGTGTLNIGINGTVQLNGASANSILGNHAGSSGIATVSGANASWNLPGADSSLIIGNSGSGLLAIDTGAHVSAHDVYIGEGYSSNGNVSVSGIGSTLAVAYSLTVADVAGGSLTISNGAQVTCGIATIGAYHSGQLIVDGAGSTFTNAGGTEIDKGSLIIRNGGAMFAGGDITTDGSPNPSLILRNGTLDMQGHNIFFPIQAEAGTLKNLGPASDDIVKTTNGILTLPTANAFGSHIDIYEGTIIVAHPDALGTGELTMYGFNASNTVQFSPGLSKAVKLPALNIYASSKLDLTNNALVLSTAGAVKSTVITSMQTLIASGKNGGTWTGYGITSSTVALDPTHYSVALADNADLHYGTFRGQSVDDNVLLIAPARFGDATLDNKVDSFDLTKLAAHWNSPSGNLWSAGDFNGDGAVNSFDLTLLAANWQFGVPGSLQAALADFPPFDGLTNGAVPEPATFAWVALALPTVIPRRKKP